MSGKSWMSVCLALAITIGLLAASTAAAAPTLTLNTGADPAESITTQLIASGTSTDKQTSLGVTVKPTGGQGCGANFSADASAGSSVVFGGEGVVEGSFSTTTNRTFDTAGSYLLCGWLTDAGMVVANTSLTFTVRSPHLALSIAAPATVAVEQNFQIVTTAQAEVRRSVEVFVLPDTGRGCPANASAAASTSGVSFVDFPAQHSNNWPVTGGPFAESSNETLKSSGQYLACGYVQYPSSQSPPEITASAAITAVAPPPPCVVPTFTSLTTLGSIQRAIKAGGCTVGSIRRVASRKVRAGYVIALNHAPGTKLASGTAVAITVSTGPPCTVPHVSAGTALGTAERRLLANHCAVGKVSSARSRRYRRGRVLRLGTRAGLVLASHAPVAVIVSRGHRR